ncbi:MAG TPA: DUF6144 family protein [Chthonomonadales bacterium]|nr:DUF6144 family protein [Chthonomonadales bacterium]
MLTTYRNGRVRKLAESLRRHGVPEETAAAVLEGGEALPGTPRPEITTAWMRGAMERMDALLDSDTRRDVREACACCLGGKRLQLSRAIARDHATFEDRLAAANRTPFVFGHSVTQEPDGRVLVCFAPEGLPEYRCVCLRGAKEPISPTYCQCCGGHIKHHLQIALGRKLECEVRSSALASGGREVCSFRYRVLG